MSGLSRHIILPSWFCGFVISWQLITITHFTCWKRPYYELVLICFDQPPVYHVRYISLWSKECFHNNAMWYYRELRSPQILLKVPFGLPTVTAYPTKLCLELSSGNTIDLEIKEIGGRCIPSRDLSNSHFLLSFSVAYDFITSYETSNCRSTTPISSLDQSIFM